MSNLIIIGHIENSNSEQNKARTSGRGAEYARIQTFPDNWKFMGKMSDQYKQIGNAVPPQLAKRVALALGKMLDEIE